jgi:hypothetical protein
MDDYTLNDLHNALKAVSINLQIRLKEISNNKNDYITYLKTYLIVELLEYQNILKEYQKRLTIWDKAKIVPLEAKIHGLIGRVNCTITMAIKNRFWFLFSSKQLLQDILNNINDILDNINEINDNTL